MAAVQFQCEACKHVVVMEASASGSQIPCPNCQKLLIVPSPPPKPAADLPQLEGYEILAKLGEGGMGAVYKARQPMLNRLVALKVMSKRFSDDATFVARFVREAAAAANLSHPNMVQVFTAGESGKVRYIAMEFVEGRTLSQHIRKHGRLDAREAVAVTIYVAQALQYAWNKARLIHRDIKPENIFLSYSGEVKVGDLGLAKSVGGDNTELTATGVTMGSPRYISPEQVKASRDVDFRADIYSLGCTLFHMLIGRPPFDAEDAVGIMMKHVSEPPPAVFEVWPECPTSLGVLLGRMLAKDRAARPQSYEKLIEELGAIHDKLGSSSPSPISPIEPTRSFVAKTITPPRRKPAGMLGAVAGLAAAVALAGLWFWAPWEKNDLPAKQAESVMVDKPAARTLAQPDADAKTRVPRGGKPVARAARPHSAPPKKVAAETPSCSESRKDRPLPARLQTIRIPLVLFREASVVDVINFLADDVRRRDESGQGRGVNIVIALTQAEAQQLRPVTLTLRDVTLHDALRCTTEMAGLRFRVDENAVVVVSSARADAVSAQPAAAKQPEKPLAVKMKTIRLPKLEFCRASLAEAAEFFSDVSREIDRKNSGGAGINVLVFPGTERGGTAMPKVTLALRDIPLSDAVRYVAEISGWQFRVDNHAVILAPAASAPSMAPTIGQREAPSTDSTAPHGNRAQMLTKAGSTAPSAAALSPAVSRQPAQSHVTSTGMELVWIPPGEFMMGSTKAEQAWAANGGCSGSFVKREGEAPRKTIIRQGFWFGRTEVTVGQWELFVAATGHQTDAEKKGFADWVPRGENAGASWKDPRYDFPPMNHHPVSCVSWNDAVAFCAWLNDRETKAGRLPSVCRVRLPTEAEWEYACRAGTQTRFWWGDAKEDGQGRVNWAGRGDGFEFVAPVDSYGERGRNPFGLADMHGNVWEWCMDDFDRTQAHEELFKGNPRARVLRGGSYSLYGYPGYCRAAYRHGYEPSYADSSYGFRVVIGLEPGVATAAPPPALPSTAVLSPRPVNTPAKAPPLPPALAARKTTATGFASLIEGVQRIGSKEGLLGPLVVDANWTPLAFCPYYEADGRKRKPAIVAAARHYGKGRVFAIGHEDFFGFGVGMENNERFGRNVIAWLGGGKGRNICVRQTEWSGAIEQGLLTRVASEGFSVQQVPAHVGLEPLHLRDFAVLVYSGQWSPITAVEKKTVLDFIQGGGGVLLTGLYWSYKGRGSVSQFPMNQIGSDLGLRFEDGFLMDPANNYNRNPANPIITRFYPAVPGAR